MAKYIHLFDTESEFLTEYRGEEYKKPWLSYTNEVRRTDYNKKYIKFEDPEVERICIENFSMDGSGLTVWDAADVTSLGGVFSGNTDIQYFDELRYFSGLTRLYGGDFKNSSLKRVRFPSKDLVFAWESFRNCGLEELTWDYPYQSADSPFYDCSAITRFNVSSWDVFFNTNEGFVYGAGNNDDRIELYVAGRKADDIIVPDGSSALTQSLMRIKCRNIYIPSSVVNIPAKYCYAAGDGTGNFINLSTATTTISYMTIIDSRFIHYVFAGDVVKPTANITSFNGMKSFRTFGNLTLIEGYGLNYTYGPLSNLEFVEVLGMVSGEYSIFGHGYNTEVADGAIVHLGYNGIACTPMHTNVDSSRVSKIYVGPGTSQAGDQAVLDQYLADPDWAQYSSKLDLWYNYDGEYKTMPQVPSN